MEKKKRICEIKTVLVPDLDKDTGETKICGYLVSFEDGTILPIYPPEYYAFLKSYQGEGLYGNVSTGTERGLAIPSQETLTVGLS